MVRGGKKVSVMSELPPAGHLSRHLTPFRSSQVIVPEVAVALLVASLVLVAFFCMLMSRMLILLACSAYPMILLRLQVSCALWCSLVVAGASLVVAGASLAVAGVSL